MARTQAVQAQLNQAGIDTPKMCVNRFSGHWSGDWSDNTFHNNVSPHKSKFPDIGGVFKKLLG